MEDESYNSVTRFNLSSMNPSDPESPRPGNFLQIDKKQQMY